MPGPATSLRCHAVPAGPDLRAHRRTVSAWALAGGLPLQRDALAAVVGARYGIATPGPAVWTAGDVGTLLWVGIAAWCRDAGADLPDADATRLTIRTYLAYLQRHDWLAPGSDGPGVLRRAVDDYAGAPSRSRHPAGRRRAPAPVVPLA